MKLLITVCIFLLFSVASTDTNADVLLQSAFPNLSFSSPVDLQNAGDSTNRIFVVTQSGVIYVFDNTPSIAQNQVKVFLDIQDHVTNGGELGLLGLAFHPNYENNGYFYVNYTAPGPLRSIIARYQVSAGDPNTADKNSELILLQIDQPFSNHNGGQLAFGPDGYLYVSLGDGGSGGDPQNNGQSLSTILGKILRIDVNMSSGGRNYSIPPDNPFFGNTAGFREEIYAYGLRNPWRFSFDFSTGRLWAGDVGQDLWEEIDLIEKGKNYGWRIMEGNHCFNPSTNCNTTGLTLPVWEYGHNSEGGNSVTGGHVYRGMNVPELAGKYVYGDFISGRVWTLSYDGINPAVNTLLLNSGLAIASFGVDRQKELYICAFDGKIYKFVSTNPPPTPTPTPMPTPSTSLIWGISGDIPLPEDYDGDKKADIVIWRPGEGNWYLLLSANSNPFIQPWGLQGDKPVPGDYDGDGKADFAVFRPSTRTWHILKSLGGIVAQKFGKGSDIPVPGDYDGDKITDIAMFRESLGGWGIKPSGGGSLIIVLWGLLGDSPVVGDFDGDGKDDITVWRGSEGNWYTLFSSGGSRITPWGQDGDIPVPGDFDGDGKDDIAVWRPFDGNWHILLSGGGSRLVQWGQDGDKPVAGDFDGNGTDDIATWRPDSGTWAILFQQNLL
jgi:glucose/arabinose dehydrogenase